VLFHGAKRLKAADISLLNGFPSKRLTLVAVSATLAADLELQLGRTVLGGRVALKPAAFRSALLGREAAQHALGLSAQKGRTIGAIGRLVPEKGFSLLMESIKDWLIANPQDRLVVVGEGPERQRLTALAQCLGISRQVHLVGHQPQAPQLYLAFDLVCIPSEQEGLGLVLPEAVIAGVPVLASDLPVFREQLGVEAELLPLAMGQWQAALCKALAGDLKQLAETQSASMDADAAWARFDKFYRQLFAP
jgi:glycosyltransferase involved in cell wall biosynthesis